MSFKHRLIIAIVTLTIRFLRATIRWQYLGSNVRPENTPCIISCWHARLLLMPFLLGKWQGPLIISDHKDGELIATVFAKFGIQASRGSSSKNGAKALLDVIRLAKQGLSPGITPDGPRGPVQIVKPGVAQISGKSNIPVVPVCYASSRYWRLSSWDRFYIPKPFCNGVVVVGEPLFINESESINDFTKRIQRGMDKAQQQADTFFQTGLS